MVAWTDSSRQICSASLCLRPSPLAFSNGANNSSTVRWSCLSSAIASCWVDSGMGPLLISHRENRRRGHKFLFSLGQSATNRGDAACLLAPRIGCFDSATLADQLEPRGPERLADHKGDQDDTEAPILLGRAVPTPDLAFRIAGQLERLVGGEPRDRGQEAGILSVDRHLARSGLVARHNRQVV